MVWSSILATHNKWTTDALWNIVKFITRLHDCYLLTVTLFIPYEMLMSCTTVTLVGRKGVVAGGCRSIADRNSTTAFVNICGYSIKRHWHQKKLEQIGLHKHVYTCKRTETKRHTLYTITKQVSELYVHTGVHWTCMHRSHGSPEWALHFPAISITKPHITSYVIWRHVRCLSGIVLVLFHAINGEIYDECCNS